MIQPPDAIAPLGAGDTIVAATTGGPMNFEFSQEQDLLREQARRLLQDHCPRSAVRAVLEGDQPFDRSLWERMSGLGWMANAIPEAYDGAGHARCRWHGRDYAERARRARARVTTGAASG